MTKAQASARQTLQRLRAAHPDAHCELVHASPFELLVATVLSAQSTDVAVNQITPDLFRRWPNAASLAAASVSDVEAALKRLGMFRQKAKNIVGLALRLVAEHHGEVPRSLVQLVALPGVGRKTANVVLGVAFGAPEGIVVDTHVQRLSQRLGWTKQTTPEKIEAELLKLFERDVWDPLSHTLIFHGRRVCTARAPACSACSISDVCPSAFKAELVGRKPLKVRSDSAANAQGPTAAQQPRAKQTATKQPPAKRSAAKPSAAKPSAAKQRPAQAESSTAKRAAPSPKRAVRKSGALR